MNKLSEIDKYNLKRDIEELAELITEIAKILNDRGNINHLIEEYADVKTSMDHIKQLFKITNKQIEEIQKKKRVFEKFTKKEI
jgi:ubiquinone biosynthesis protein UbiJ